MKTAISLPDPLYAAADRLARRLGISRSELIQRALLALVEEQDDRSVTETLNTVYGETGRSACVESLVTRLQLASLEKETW